MSIIALNLKSTDIEMMQISCGIYSFNNNNDITNGVKLSKD